MNGIMAKPGPTVKREPTFGDAKTPVGEMPRNGLVNGGEDRKIHGGDAVMPIAVVGLGGRFPGDASNPENLWDLIANRKSAMTEVPKDRFNIDSFYHPHHERQNAINARGAHFMKMDVSSFDAPFFSITPSEAKSMDPQQRMALECTYEALENAGLRMEDIVGSNTSCYVGSFTRDYPEMVASDRENLPLYHGIGAGDAILSNRISWFFDLRGPSISIDTACSSSLVALHLGCQSLRTGESEMAIVGGTNLILMPDIISAMSNLHFLSPDSKCHSFDSRANGYARGEGTSFIILKPLDLALQNGDMIRGIIRNTAVNQDGNTPGITTPSSEAQEALIRRCYSAAGLSLADTQLCEAHGTGTPVGDPIEAAALARTFGFARPKGDPVLIGSVKSNIGHLEGASGLAQITKSILALEKGMIPPNIWFEKPNPRIPMEEWNIQIPTNLTRWPAGGQRRISINSFGYGGTNAHCIVDDAYHYLKSRGLRGNHNTVHALDCSSPASFASSDDSAIAVKSSDITPLEVPGSSHSIWSSGFSENGAQVSSQPSTKKRSRESTTGGDTAMEIDSSIDKFDAERFRKRQRKSNPCRLFVWSSNEQTGVDRLSNLYSEYLEQKLFDCTDMEEETLLRKFAYTLAVRRSVLPWKCFALGSTLKEVIAGLTKPEIKPLRSSTSPKLGFVFTGQGAQWAGMGRELFGYAIFEQSMKSADSYLLSLGCEWSLIEELWRDGTTRLNTAAVSQPICTALQVALVELLTHWGITASATVGHSSGEIAAAYTQGSITREAAWTIAYYRGKFSAMIAGLLPNRGAMLATGIGPADAEQYLERLAKGQASVACINSGTSTTLSGDESAILELERLIKSDGHFARRLKVDTAYHSHHMKVVEDLYLQSLADLKTMTAKESSPKMFSSVTGQAIGDSDLGAQYWVSNMTSQVNFLGAVESMCRYSDNLKSKRPTRPYVDVLVEIGPAAALQGPLKQILNAEGSKFKNVVCLSALQRSQDAQKTSLELVGQLFRRGYVAAIPNVNECQIGTRDKAFLVDIPPFPWNHSNKYWAETALSRNHRFKVHARKDLFGAQTHEGLEMEPRWRNVIRLSEMPWVEYHKVQGTILYPAAGMMVMAIEAACQNADPTREIEGYELRDVQIGKAIVIPNDDSGTDTMLCFKPWRLGSKASTSVWQEWTLFSRSDENWELNCSGLILVKYKASSNFIFEDEDNASHVKYREKFLEVGSQCEKPRGSRQFYDHLESIGLHYGPLFQNLVEVREGHYSATCALKIPDTRNSMPAQFEYSHVIHPATLDNVIQMCIPAATGMNEELTIAQVPTSIGRLYVSADVPTEPGSMLEGYAFAENIDFDGEATIVVSNSEWKKPLVVFEHLRSTGMRQAEAGFALSSSIRKPISFIHWQEDLQFLDQKNMSSICADTIHDMPTIEGDTVRELELTAFIYMKRVLKVCTSEEAETFLPHLHKFYTFMQRTHERVVRGEVAHQTTEVDWLNTSEEFETQLIERVSLGSADGALLRRHGENLVSILRGEQLAIEVLMKDNCLANLYQFGVGCAETYAQLAKFVDLAAHKNPNMKILEIGAGTGGATLPVLDIMGGRNGTAPRFTNYTYTDISSGFFEKAAEKFKTWAPFMTFAKLNVEEDPFQQGFQEAEYDLVIAANVLHATKVMDVTLANVRKLMKPGAKLVLSEITNPLLRSHMTVGSFEGWWMGEQDDREWGPTLTVPRWNELLVRQNFTGVDLTLNDIPSPRDQMYSVIVTSATSTEALTIPEDVLIIQPQTVDSQLQKLLRKMKKEIKQSGAKSVTTATLPTAAKLDLSQLSCLFLLECNSNSAMLPEINSEDWDSLKKVIFGAANSTWITRGATIGSENPPAAMMVGLSRATRAENPSLIFTTIDLDSQTPMDSPATVANIIKIFVSRFNAENSTYPDWEYAIRSDKIMVQRVLLEKGMNDLITNMAVTPKPEMGPFDISERPLDLQVGTPGRLDTLRWNDDLSYKETLTDSDVEIKVKAVGLNFKDIMIAMGQLKEHYLGFECSGIVTRVGPGVEKIKIGDRVITWKVGCFRTLVCTPESMVVLMPPDMSFGDAASVPLVFSTAFYAIFTAAKLKRGETILIHGAAGGVGQAAVMLAQYVGAEVFATVSSDQKKWLLIKTYGIPEDHIFNSRDTSFAQGIMRMTNQKGVNVVLNSLAGEALRQSWHCIAWFGRFIEMGQKDIVGNTGLDMAPFMRNVSFHSINLIGVLENDLPTMAWTLHMVMKLFKQRVARIVKPVTCLPFSKIEEAFRLMQTGQHTGKIVLELEPDEIVPVVPAGVAPIRFRDDKTYILTGGLGGLGRSLAQWMISNGAKNLVFLSRSGGQRPEAEKALAKFTTQGAKVAAYSCDISDAENTQIVLQLVSQEFPPIAGLIQGAMVLNDAPYENMTHEQYLAAVRPKVQGSWNMHQHLPKDLDFFVMLASSSGIAGSRAQGNYSAGNAYQDALAHWRRKQGLHATTIDLGVVLGVGFLEENKEERVGENTKSWNFTGIREKELHAVVQAAITGESTHGEKIPPQIITGLATGGMVALAGQQFPWWSNDAKFAHVKHVDTHQACPDVDQDSVQLQSLLSQATSVDAAAEVVSTALVKKLAKSMMVDIQDIEASRPISSYGVDSLLAVEVRSWIFTEIQADISVFDLLSNTPISLLARRIVLKSKCVPKAVLELEA